MKLLLAASIVLLVVARTARWRRALGAQPLTAKVAAIALAVGWVAAVLALLFIV